MSDWIKPDWPLSSLLNVVSTTRAGGFSSEPYQSLNLGLHVGDTEAVVRQNRAAIAAKLQLPSEPIWLNQTHSTAVCDADPENNDSYDAAWSKQADRVLCVMTADCLPVVIATTDAREFAVAHAGWKGMADGVIISTLKRFEAPTTELTAWLGPAISSKHFEVGLEVRERFVQNWHQLDAEHVRSAFTRENEGKCFADLYALARMQLRALGVDKVYGGDHCTFTEKDRFFSYRRDGLQSGRMATLVWR